VVFSQSNFKSKKLLPMKKILLALIITGAFTTVANAQEKEKTKPPMAAALSKEEKAQAKLKMEADLNAAFKEAGLTDDEIKLTKAAMEENRQKRNDIKKDATLSEEDKTKKTQEIKDAEKAKLTEIMGAAKYKAFKEAQKKQKAAAGM